MAKSTVTAKDPGTVLKTFLDDYQLNPSKLGKEVQLSQSTIRQITLNKMKISIPIAMRFAKYFGNSVDYWINLQTKYSMIEAEEDAELNGILNNINKAVKPSASQKAAAKSALKERAKKTAAALADNAAKPARKPRGRKPKTI